jgi:Uma2 family endonuclease
MSTTTEAPGRPSLHGARMSVEEFLALPDDGIHRELIRGMVREFPGDAEQGARMTVRNRFHSQIQANVTGCLVEWWRARPRPRGAVVCGEAGFRLKGTADSLVGIDVAVASAELVAAMDPDERIYNGPPILAIEILSPRDTHDEIVETVRTYHAVGTVVWIIDPDFETVAVHRPGEEVQTLNSRQELDGEPYLPGFRVPVARCFEWD